MRRRAALCVASALLACGAAPDPAAPLAVLNGNWLLATAGAPLVHLANRCAAVGGFITCEQSVEGKPQALLVFHPEGATQDGGQEYRTMTLVLPVEHPGAWSRLVINGPRWVYDDGPQAKPGPEGITRVTDEFLTPDRIRFTRERTKDGVHWVVVQGGDEKRE